MALKYECYFLTVPFTNDYKHLYLNKNVANETQQINDFASHASLHLTNLNVIVKNNSFIIRGRLEDFTSYNYIIFKGDEQTHWTYAFINDSYYHAFRGTIIEHQIDVFQTYYFRSSFKKAIIERAHISKSEDNTNWHKYTEPEPIGFPAILDDNIGSYNIDFSPVLVMDASSMPDSTVNTTFNYGGRGTTDAGYTGTYRIKMPSGLQSRNAFMWLWSIGDYQQSTISHISDIMGFSYIPQWIDSKASWDSSPLMTGSYVLKSNVLESTDDTSLNISNTLACGYTPNNKKMYTSLARAFKIWNKNGLSIPLKPELLNSRASIGIKLYMRPMGTTYKLEILGYKDLTSRYIDLPYSYTIGISMNSNTGTVQQTNIADLKNQADLLKKSQTETAKSAVANVFTTAFGGVSNTAGAVNKAMYAEQGTPKADMLSGAAAITGISSIVSLGALAYTGGATLDRQAAQMEVDNFQMTTAINNAYSSIGVNLGTNTDRTSMTEDFCKIRLATCSPTEQECRVIDDFLDAYGYALNEFGNPTSYFKTRSNWNYIKTKNNSVSINGCDNDAYIFKNIFNNGTTLWHTWTDFGDYTKTNS